MPANHSVHSETDGFSTAIDYALLIALAALVIAVVLLSWVPPVSRDALTHHLAVPKLYIQNGGMVKIPYVSFSYYPMNLDLLYLVPLYFGNDILPKLIHFAFGLLTAWLLFSYLQRRLNRTYALLGALFFLSIPVIVKLSITVYVDLGLVYFSTASLLLLFRWAESGFKYGYIFAAAVFCGLALGTKYNALVVLALLTMAVPVLVIRASGTGSNQQLKSVGWAVVYLSIALAVFSPWMIRNYQWTGNPIYPLYNKVFQSAPDRSPEADAHGDDIEQAPKHKVTSWNHFKVRRIIYGESWLEIALLPIRIFFQGQDNNPKYFDGKLTPFLLLLLLPAFNGIRKDPAMVRLEKYLLLAFVVLFILIAFQRAVIRIRYIAPIIPPLVLLSIYGLANLLTFVRRRTEGWQKNLGLTVNALIIGAMFAVNGVYIASQFKEIAPFNYISGKVSREAYITRYRPEYPVFEYANQHLAEDVKILGMFIGNRRYYSDRKLVFGEMMMANAFLNARSVEDIRSLVKRKGFTHLIIHSDLYRKWASGFVHGEARIIDAFFTQNTKLLHSNGNYGLYSFTFERS